MGEQIVPWEGAILEDRGAPFVKYMDFLPWTVQKRLNWSICHLGCGLGWAKRSWSSIVFVRWRQRALMGGHVGATWQLQLNRPSVAAMRPYVRLLWPLLLLLFRLFFSKTCSVKMYVIAICCINDAHQKSYRDACKMKPLLLLNNPLHVFLLVLAVM